MPLLLSIFEHENLSCGAPDAFSLDSDWEFLLGVALWLNTVAGREFDPLGTPTIDQSPHAVMQLCGHKETEAIMLHIVQI